jgi:hypothetical protein
MYQLMHPFISINEYSLTYVLVTEWIHIKRPPDDGDLRHRNICRGILIYDNKKVY